MPLRRHSDRTPRRAPSYLRQLLVPDTVLAAVGLDPSRYASTHDVDPDVETDTDDDHTEM